MCVQEVLSLLDEQTASLQRSAFGVELERAVNGTTWLQIGGNKRREHTSEDSQLVELVSRCPVWQIIIDYRTRAMRVAN